MRVRGRACAKTRLKVFDTESRRSSRHPVKAATSRLNLNSVERSRDPYSAQPPDGTLLLIIFQSSRRGLSSKYIPFRILFSRRKFLPAMKVDRAALVRGLTRHFSCSVP